MAAAVAQIWKLSITFGHRQEVVRRLGISGDDSRGQKLELTSRMQQIQFNSIPAPFRIESNLTIQTNAIAAAATSTQIQFNLLSIMFQSLFKLYMMTIKEPQSTSEPNDGTTKSSRNRLLLCYGSGSGMVMMMMIMTGLSPSSDR